MANVNDRISENELAHYRNLDCALVLKVLAEHVKIDPTFVPILNHTQRWYACVGGREFELLTTGPKWYDARQNRGGGGAIDLTMHLFGIGFKPAVTKLRLEL